MKREDIIRLAKESGFPCIGDEPIIACGRDNLHRFAALVAADTRERCANVCDEFAKLFHVQAVGGDNTGASDHMQNAAEQISEEIRALVGE